MNSGNIMSCLILIVLISEVKGGGQVLHEHCIHLEPSLACVTQTVGPTVFAASRLTTALISKVHSFPRKIWPNLVGQFAKFRGSAWPSVCE